MPLSQETTEDYYPKNTGTDHRAFNGTPVQHGHKVLGASKSTGQDKPGHYSFTIMPDAASMEHSSGGWLDGRRVRVSISERELETMARSRPSQLADLIRNDLLDDVDLAFAARAAAEVQSMILVDILIELLDHSSGFVREGAIYGLAPHLAANERIQKALTGISGSDPNLGVREAAQEALDG